MTSLQRQPRTGRQKGFVLITMTAAAIAMIGAMGLAVDLGHVFIIKNETQAFADAAALAAALQLDGTTAGITRAGTAATSLTNKWNFDTTSVPSPTVEYAVTSTGTWYDAASVPDPSTIIYARVTATTAPNIYFIPVVLVNKVYTMNVKSMAVAGQVDFANNTEIIQGLGPYAAVASSNTGPKFGFTVGDEYDVQWPQYNGTRKNCSNANGNLDNCFVNSTCSGETTAAKQEVVQYWGSKTNGYRGSSGTSNLNAYILDEKQLQALNIGDNIDPVLSNGDKQGTAQIMDNRVNQDPVNYGNDLTAYLDNPAHNGRRLMPVPVVLPSSNNSSPVVGYGLMFLLSDQTAAGGTSAFYQSGDANHSANGNAPYCAIYAGPFVLGSMNPGGGSSSGGSRVKLVQ